MHIIYRLCDIPSTNPPPMLEDNKRKLNIVCLKNFLESFSDRSYEVIFLCDNTGDYNDILDGFTVEYSNNGINYTYLRSLEIAKDLNDDVLFQECDYWHKPNAIPEIEQAVKHFGYVTGYDHPDKYPTKHTEIEFFNGRHWKTAPSTTMTFAASRENIDKDYSLLTKYGYLDSQMWENLYKEANKKLWTPIPSLSTHMVKDHLAPGMNLWI